jgi:hypothetical protein
MALIAALCATSVFAGNDCKKGNFVGTYTRADLDHDVIGDGTVHHSYIYQLQLHSDGSASQMWTGLSDYTISIGTGTHQIGSWTCRSDGKLVVNLLSGVYLGSTVDIGDGPKNDILLWRTIRDVYLFTITDSNTLTRTQSRRRNYTPSEDPTDPAAGSLGPLSTDTFVYTRLMASDADLLVP